MSEFFKEEARVSQLPWRNGDGYSWGGEVILSIGGTALLVGSGNPDLRLAMEIARRWNAARRDAGTDRG